MAISIYLEININKNSVYQRYWDMAKEKPQKKIYSLKYICQITRENENK